MLNTVEGFKMAKADSAVAEYMRIRRYVLTLIQKANGKSVPLPSILELSERFQVSRPTVSRAMKALTEAGYVIGRRGIGSFTNPATSSRFLSDRPMIGLLVGDGMNVHFDQYLSSMFGHLMMAISAIPAVVHLLSLSSVKPDHIIQAIQNEQLDALVWHDMAEENIVVRDQLVAAGLPVVVSSGRNVAFGAGSVRIGFRELGYACGKALIAEGKKNLVFLPAAQAWAAPLPGFLAAYEEAGIPLNENLFLSDPATCLEDLRKLLTLGVPIDAVFNAVFVQNEVGRLLDEFRIDRRNQCRLIESSLSIRGEENFCGLTYEFPFQAHAAQIALQIKKQLDGEGASHEEMVTRIRLDMVTGNVKTPENASHRPDSISNRTTQRA